MNWFKNKEEKVIDLNKELILLIEKNKDSINTYCKIGQDIFMFLGFVIKDRQIFVKFKNENTLDGYNNLLDIDIWDLKYDELNFNRMRINFLKLKENLAKIGLKLEKL